MIINDHIEYLHRVITGVKSGDVISMCIFNKLFAIGIISIFYEINKQLEELSLKLDKELDLEATSLNFDLYLNKEYWTNNWLFSDNISLLKECKIDYKPRSYYTEINQITDYLPNGIEDYKTTPDVLDSFKVAMHQLCDDDKMYQRDLLYALRMGLEKMLKLLAEIKKKTKNPKNYLYIKLWEQICEIFDNEEYDKEYNEWKEDIGEPSFEELKARQKQEIFKFLCTGFLRFCPMPTGAEVRNCKLKITADDLQYGTKIPENIDIECARFVKFFEWKDEVILSLNYEKIGKYISKNQNSFDETEFFNVTDFDKIIEIIHEAMAVHKPQLAKYLKRYEINKQRELITDCKKLLNSCKPFVSKKFDENILEKYYIIIQYFFQLGKL